MIHWLLRCIALRCIVTSLCEHFCARVSWTIQIHTNASCLNIQVMSFWSFHVFTEIFLTMRLKQNTLRYKVVVGECVDEFVTFEAVCQSFSQSFAHQYAFMPQLTKVFPPNFLSSLIWQSFPPLPFYTCIVRYRMCTVCMRANSVFLHV